MVFCKAASQEFHTDEFEFWHNTFPHTLPLWLFLWKRNTSTKSSVVMLGRVCQTYSSQNTNNEWFIGQIQSTPFTPRKTRWTSFSHYSVLSCECAVEKQDSAMLETLWRSGTVVLWAKKANMLTVTRLTCWSFAVITFNKLVRKQSRPMSFILQIFSHISHFNFDQMVVLQEKSDDHQSSGNSSRGGHECLNHISWKSI